MNNFKQVQKLDRVSPPTNNPFKRYPVLGDASLSYTVTEYIGGFSLCPSYSVRQLRKINYIEKRKVKHTHRNLKWFLIRSNRSVPVHRQVLVKNIHNQEAIL
jgi:hypothetical protein